MGIGWQNRGIADPRLLAVSGMRSAGGYLLRLSIEFDVHNWTERDGPIPLVLLLPARVWIAEAVGLFIGFAHPETTQAFMVGPYSSKSALLFDLPVSHQAMEAIEGIRDGQGVRLLVKLQAEVRRGAELQVACEDVRRDLNLSEWIGVLEQAGYGQRLLFEVPLPPDTSVPSSLVAQLRAARDLMASGHYAETVAKCRLVLESLTQELNEGAALKAALGMANKQDRSLHQRELAMRQATMDLTHLAHHADGAATVAFDRGTAKMVLAVVTALVSTALSRRGSAP